MTENRIADLGHLSGQMQGWWRLDEGNGRLASDSSGHGRTATCVGDVAWTDGPGSGGAVRLDGATTWFGTSEPVVRTDQAFSVAAWVRLDSATIDRVGGLPTGLFARTAVSQDGPSHSPFYLGIRALDERQTDGSTKPVTRWTFTVAPVDGSTTGKLEWRHARSAHPVDASAMDTWVLLVGVCDVVARTTRLHLPGVGDGGTDRVGEEWVFWPAQGGLQLGQARYLDRVVDHWPGSVSDVRVYSGALTAEDAANLYRTG